MALTSAQRRHYLDRMTAYRPDEGEIDALGNVATGVRAVPGVVSVPCKLHETRQFQSKRAPGIRINQDNLETADSVSYEMVHEVREDDWLRIVRRTGETVWYSAAGNPQRVPEGNYAAVFLQTTPPPEVVS